MKKQVDQRISTSSHAHSDFLFLFYFIASLVLLQQMGNNQKRDKFCENVAIFKEKECVCVCVFCLPLQLKKLHKFKILNLTVKI
jgi:hypothetical protein